MLEKLWVQLTCNDSGQVVYRHVTSSCIIWYRPKRNDALWLQAWSNGSLYDQVYDHHMPGDWHQVHSQRLHQVLILHVEYSSLVSKDTKWVSEWHISTKRLLVPSVIPGTVLVVTCHSQWDYTMPLHPSAEYTLSVDRRSSPSHNTDEQTHLCQFRQNHSCQVLKA